MSLVSKEDTEDQGESNLSLLNNKIEKQIFTFYIKVFGKHTLSLQQKAVDQEKIKLRISRPLGRPHLDLSGSEYGDFETIVLIADGVGITPWISVLQYTHEKEHIIKTQYVHLIWSIHTIGKPKYFTVLCGSYLFSLDTYHAFEKDLIEFTSNLQQIKMDVHIFVTGNTSDPEESRNGSTPFTLKYNRPNYPSLLNDIPNDDVAVGVCTHDITSIQIHNLALARSWAIHTERFQL